MISEILIKQEVLNPGERTKETRVGSLCVGEEMVDHTRHVCRHIMTTTTTEDLDAGLRGAVVLAGGAYIKGQQCLLSVDMLCLRILKSK